MKKCAMDENISSGSLPVDFKIVAAFLLVPMIAALLKDVSTTNLCTDSLL